MDRKTLLTTLLIGGGTDAGTAIAQLQHAVSVLEETKADKTGAVALANNLTPYSADSGATQSVPFINQGTGCGNGESVVDTGSYAQIKEKLGNTVGVNQLINPANYEADKTADGVTFEKQADGRIKITVATSPVSSVKFRVTGFNVFTLGHKFLLSLQNNYGAGKLNLTIANATYSSIAVGQDNLYDTIWQAVGDVTQLAFSVNVRAGCATGTYYVRPISSDLDRWFGSTDRIPSDLLSHPEYWGRYYAGSLAYNAGTLDSADGTVMKSIGRNFFDKSKATAHAQLSNDGTVYAHSSITSSVSDYTPVSPNTDIYFKDVFNLAQKRSICWYDIDKNLVKADGIYESSGDAVSGMRTSPANARFVRCTIPDVDTCVFSLYYPGESGYDQYYPYSVLAEVDTGSEVLRSAGAVADEKTPDGTITRRVGVVDLGTLTWSRNTSGTYPVFIATLSGSPSSITANFINIQCAKYEAIGATSLTTFQGADYDKKICHRNNNTTILVQDSSILTADAFITAMSGIYLYYELATPTTEQGTPFSGASADNFAIDDFGSMYWTQSAGVPQGVEIFYPYDYKAAVDTLLNMVNGDVEELVTETELGAVAVRIPEAPAEDGTYTLKATVADGVKTYAWVADT